MTSESNSHVFSVYSDMCINTGLISMSNQFNHVRRPGNFELQKFLKYVYICVLFITIRPIFNKKFDQNLLTFVHVCISNGKAMTDINVI